jgi:hypothetical protein
LTSSSLLRSVLKLREATPSSRRRLRPRLRPVRLFRKFLQLGRGQRRAIVRAAVLLVAARIALLLIPFTTVLRFAARPRTRGAARADRGELDEMVWAVDAVGNRLFPRNPCLVQALVVQRLFVRAGQLAELRIGVRKEGASKLTAHAWVESDGVIVIGSRGLSDDYVALPPIRPGGPSPDD